MARVAIVGSYGVGLTVQLDRVPEAGETVIGRAFRTDHGGKGSNQAVGAARLGARGGLPHGDRRRRLRPRGASRSGRRPASAPRSVTAPAATMAAPILVEPSGQNRIVVVPGALAYLTRAHVDAFAGRIAAADVCVVQLEIPVDTALYALEVARGAGVRTILNPAPAPPEPIAPAVDYLTPNETEAPAVAGAEGTLVLTLGEQGARLGETLVPAFPAHAGRHDGRRRRVHGRLRGRARRGPPRPRGRPLGLRRRRAHGRARGCRPRPADPRRARGAPAGAARLSARHSSLDPETVRALPRPTRTASRIPRTIQPGSTTFTRHPQPS